MTDAQRTIQKAVLAARKDWLHYTVKQERQIYALFEDAANRIQDRIQKYARKGKIPPSRLVTLLGVMNNPHPDSIRGVLRELRPRLQSQIKGAMTQSVNFGMQTQIYGLSNASVSLPPHAQLAIGSSFIGADGKIRTYDVKRELYKNSTWARVNTDAMDALMRTQYGQITLSQRVWDISWDAEKRIRNRVNTAVLLGESPNKLASDTKLFLRNPYARFHRVRKDGRLVLSKPARAYHPGRGVYRSAYQNARRVARTEMARAYNEGTVRYVKRKKWLKGFISHVGSDNPAEYDASVDGKFFPKDSPPMIPYHPNCMCYATPVFVTVPDEQLEFAPSL